MRLKFTGSPARRPGATKSCSSTKARPTAGPSPARSCRRAPHFGKALSVFVDHSFWGQSVKDLGGVLSQRRMVRRARRPDSRPHAGRPIEGDHPRGREPSCSTNTAPSPTSAFPLTSSSPPTPQDSREAHPQANSRRPRHGPRLRHQVHPAIEPTKGDTMEPNTNPTAPRPRTATPAPIA